MLRTTASILILAGLAFTAGGCGSSEPKSTNAATDENAAPSARAPAAARCDQFCLQAGPAGGPNPAACPAEGGLCKRHCPASGCIDLTSPTARVAANGVAVV